MPFLLSQNEGKDFRGNARSRLHFLSSVATVAFLSKRREKCMGNKSKNTLAFVSCYKFKVLMIPPMKRSKPVKLFTWEILM